MAEPPGDSAGEVSAIGGMVWNNPTLSKSMTFYKYFE